MCVCLPYLDLTALRGGIWAFQRQTAACLVVAGRYDNGSHRADRYALLFFPVTVVRRRLPNEAIPARTRKYRAWRIVWTTVQRVDAVTPNGWFLLPLLWWLQNDTCCSYDAVAIAF